MRIVLRVGGILILSMRLREEEEVREALSEARRVLRRILPQGIIDAVRSSREGG